MWKSIKTVSETGLWSDIAFRLGYLSRKITATWPIGHATAQLIPVQLVRTWTLGLHIATRFLQKLFSQKGCNVSSKKRKVEIIEEKIFRVTMATFQSLLRKKCLIGQIWVFEIEFWETLPYIYTVGSQKFWRMCRFRSLPVWLGSCSRIRHAPQLQRGRNESREPHADAEPLPSWLKCIRWGH